MDGDQHLEVPATQKHVSPEIIVGVAKMLGIDAVNEPEYLWIAEQCAKADLPSNDWRELTNENGETMYYHVCTKRLQKLHPLLEQYAGLYHKQASFVKMSGTTQQTDLDSNSTRLSGIITEILNRVTSHLPPMTPEMVDKVALLLECDTKAEYFLARVIKQTIEAYVEISNAKMSGSGRIGTCAANSGIGKNLYCIKHQKLPISCYASREFLMRDRHQEACAKPVMLLRALETSFVIQKMHDKLLQSFRPRHFCI